MKKLLFIAVCCLCLCGCGNKEDINNTSNNENINKNNPIESITLNSDNGYFQISSIDFSKCTYDNETFSGTIYFTSTTKQSYVETYSKYFYRTIYFGFYDEDDNLVNTEIVQNNYLYSREYTQEENSYVSFSSHKPITNVKVIKIVIEKPIQSTNNK